MTLYDVLNKFYNEMIQNESDLDVLKISKNYEYYSILMSAYLFSCNNPEGTEKYYQNQYPTFGTVYSRFDFALKNDRQNIFYADNQESMNYFNSIERLNSEISCIKFDEGRDFSDMLNTDFIISVKCLIKFVLYIRNQYVHENVHILNSFMLYLNNVYKELIEITKKFTIIDSTEFLVIQNNTVYCLNSIVPKHVYKNINFCSIELDRYPFSIKYAGESKDGSSEKAILINGIEFIPFAGGNISYIQSGFKKPIDDYVESFAISKYPITNRQFLEFLEFDEQYYKSRCLDPLFMKDYLSFDKNKKEAVKDCAVYYISWSDAALFCNYLSKKAGRDTAYKEDMSFVDNYGVRLPSEAEWVFAATCGQGITNSIPKNIVCRENRIGLYNKVAKNINLYENQDGVCGMLGNINEWTNTDASVIRFKKFESSHTDFSDRKIIKGGSFATQRRIISYNYATDVKKDNLHYIGFRVLVKL